MRDLPWMPAIVTSYRSVDKALSTHLSNRPCGTIDRAKGHHPAPKQVSGAVCADQTSGVEPLRPGRSPRPAGTTTYTAVGWDNYLHRGRLDPTVAVSDARSIYRISKDTIAADGVDR